jgi:hypothetical protein
MDTAMFGGMSETCESCGGTEATLTAVRRMYVTPETWESEHKQVVLPDVEQWCFACLTQYPHERLD